jgi:hypothetical protein
MNTRCLKMMSAAFYIAVLAVSARTTAGKETAATHKVAHTATIDAAWTPIGPAPIKDGQTENISNDSNAINSVAGAINAVVCHPTDANTVWIATVNGGIWKTTNALAASPTWQTTTDTLATLSFGAITLDPLDATYHTLVAASGGSSNFSSSGINSVNGPLGKILRTTDGTNWSVASGNGIAGRNITDVLARGSTIVVSSAVVVGPTCDGGVFRSTDTGANFSQVGTVPGGDVFHLSGDPADSTIMYTAVHVCNNLSVDNGSGIYRSADSGATWTRISNSTMNDRLRDQNANNARVVVGPQHHVFAGIVIGGSLDSLWSWDGSSTWTSVTVPTTTESDGHVYGIHTDAAPQGRRNFSMAADPTHANIVYVGGDAQPLPAFPLKNSIGATDFTGRLFRIDASSLPGHADPLTHCSAADCTTVSTTNNSAPHADSRAIAVDAGGSLIETDDGGVYRRTTPTASGVWQSMNGALQLAEAHDAAWDHVSHVAITGSQDNGTEQQTTTGALIWERIGKNDGGDVAVDDTTSPSQSIRLSSYQFLGGFSRGTYNAAGTLTASDSPHLTVLSGNTPVWQFVTPVELNHADQNSLLLAGANDLYESVGDHGDTISSLGLASQMTAATYGTSDNTSVIYAVRSGFVYQRTSAGGQFSTLTTPWSSAVTIRDVAVDPGHWLNAYVIFNAGGLPVVYATSNGGSNWTNITGNLGTLTTDVRTIVFIPGSPAWVVTGGASGVFRTDAAAPGTWSLIAAGMPNTMVDDLDYDAADQTLLAATMGRGVWKLGGVGNSAPPPAPTNLVATAQQINTAVQVHVTWNASSGAASYNVYRTNGTGYTKIGSVSALSYDDGAVSQSAATAYLYKVRAADASNAESSDSNVDLATVKAYTNQSVATGSFIAAIDFTELLSSVNAVRALAQSISGTAVPAVTFTLPAPSTGSGVLLEHMTDLRNGLDGARSALSLPALTYTDVPILRNVTTIKALHVTELRTDMQ